MKTKKLLACLVSCSMLAVSMSAFAAAPSKYDGQTYSSMGYESDDPDGVFNLAVIANGDVEIGNAMYIEGSVYSNGTIYVHNGQGNDIDGLFISGTENTTQYVKSNIQYLAENNYQESFDKTYLDGYYAIGQYDSNSFGEDVTYYTAPEYEGAILDTDTSFECSYDEFTVPEIENNLGDVTMNVYAQGTWTWSEEKGFYQLPSEDSEKTVTEDTAYDTVTMNGSQNANGTYKTGLTIDTTESDVTVVINSLPNPTNPSIKVVGDHDAYIYINNVDTLNNLSLNYNTMNWPAEKDGSVEKTHLYINGGDVSFGAGKIAVADMHVTADTLSIAASTIFYGDIYSNVKEFTITGGQNEVHGTVCVPYAASNVIDSGILYGQLHTDTLKNNGAGSIIWQADTAVAKSESTPEPTEAPTATSEPTVEPTLPPIPTGEEISLSGAEYAYIFGYEPEIEYVLNEETGEGSFVAEVEMAPNDSVTREQVSAMIMRLIEQKYDTKDAVYALTDNMLQHEGTWYARGLGYLASTGAFDGIASVECGAVTRGEVAKLVAFGLNLSETADVDYTDVAGNQYEEYIKIMSAHGYMNGMDDGTFQPDKVMTRAEFCAMFNNVIGRTDAGLTAEDGTEVTPELYSIVDLDSDAWYTDVMLKATSAYDDNGYVDIETRLSNIRNILDDYEAQLLY